MSIYTKYLDILIKNSLNKLLLLLIYKEILLLEFLSLMVNNLNILVRKEIQLVKKFILLIGPLMGGFRDYITYVEIS